MTIENINLKSIKIEKDSDNMYYKIILAISAKESNNFWEFSALYFVAGGGVKK